MTTLVAWTKVTSGRANAVYLASDSRITWGGPKSRWDAGRKLFACRTSADIFGFCGDLVFPSQILSQIVDLADSGLLFNSNARSVRRHAAVVAAIKTSNDRRHNAPDRDFEILHVSRQGEGDSAAFKAWLVSYVANSSSWEDREIKLQPVTAGQGAPTFAAFGSGGSEIKRKLQRSTVSGEQASNRAVFTALTSSLADGDDARSGPPPQLIGLYSSGPGRSFGIVHEGNRYLHGLPAGAIHSGRLEWRDQDFQAIDGATLRPKKLIRRRDRSRTRLENAAARHEMSKS